MMQPNARFSPSMLTGLYRLMVTGLPVMRVLFLLGCLLACIAGWAWALWRLAHARAFRALFSAHPGTEQPLAQCWLPRTGHSTPERTLLHGFHASWTGRFTVILSAYVPAILAISLHTGFLSILARLEYWSGWVQALAVSLSATVAVLVLLLSFRSGSPLPFQMLGGVLLLLTLAYYWRCKRCFFAVDWLRLRPTRIARKRRGSA